MEQQLQRNILIRGQGPIPSQYCGLPKTNLQVKECYQSPLRAVQLHTRSLKKLLQSA